LLRRRLGWLLGRYGRLLGFGWLCGLVARLCRRRAARGALALDRLLGLFERLGGFLFSIKRWLGLLLRRRRYSQRESGHCRHQHAMRHDWPLSLEDLLFY
jgi:hypothetical protein